MSTPVDDRPPGPERTEQLDPPGGPPASARERTEVLEDAPPAAVPVPAPVPTGRRYDPEAATVSLAPPAPPSGSTSAVAGSASERTEILSGVSSSASRTEPGANVLVFPPGQTPLPRPSKLGPIVDASLPIVDGDHYDRLGEHARGGLGRIVRARDQRTGRVVALKEMLSTTPQATKRFAREALITANLQHPAIVPVYELGRWRTGEPFFAMKLVAGKPFDKVLAAAKTLDDRLARLPVILSVAEALAYAHQRRVIHRDLKPANVLVGDYGETVVIDWGLAKSLDEVDAPGEDELAVPAIHVDPTVAGAVMGTPSYMAPEQARGEELDARADVYAIGAMLYHLISGRRPYADRNPRSSREIVDAAASEPPTPLERHEAGAPKDLVAIANKAMARTREDRYVDASTLADDLRRFLTGQLVSAHHYNRRQLLARWVKRHRAPVTVGAVLASLLIATGTLGVRGILVERDRVRAQRDIALAESARAERELATLLYEKGRAAEGTQEWARAAMYYAASRWHHDTPAAAWAAGLAEARAIVPVTRYTQHAAWVHGTAISADGSRAVTVDEAGEIHVWSPADGRTLARARATTPLYAVAFSPRGDELATAGDDGTIQRRTLDLAVKATLTGHTGRVWSVAYSPDGAWLASGGEDARVRMYPLDGVATPRELLGHKQRVYSVAFSPDGTRLASGSDDRHLWLWDVAKGTGTSRGHHVAGGIRVVAFVDGGLLTTGWDHEIRVWRDGIASPDIWSDTHIVHGAAVTRAGDIVFTAGETGAIRAWDITTHQLITSLDAPGGQTSAVALSRDGRWLVTGGKAAPIAWDARPLARLGTLGHRTDVIGLSFAPEGQHFASGSTDRTLRVWDAITASEIRKISTVALCGDGVLALPRSELLASCDDRVVRRWDTTGQARELAVDEWLRFTTLSPDASTVAAGHIDGRVGLIDLASWRLVTSRKLHDHHLYDVRYARDGRLVTASLDDHVRTWRTPELTPDLDIQVGGEDGVLAGSLSPDGGQLAAGGQDGLLRIWDTRAARWLRQRADVAAGTVWKLAYAPDGSHAFTAHDDGVVRIWDPSTWEAPGLLDAGEGTALTLAVSPDGRTLVTGYKSGAIAVWDVPTRALRHRIGGRQRDRGSCADIAKHVWVDVAQQEIVTRACSTPARAYLGELSARSQQRLLDEVDVVWRWDDQQPTEPRAD